MKKLLMNFGLMISLLVLQMPVEAESGFNLADYKGKVVYLDFWASWCGPCRQSFPWMNQLHRDLHDKGLVVIGLNVDVKRDEANDFLTELPAEFKVFFDPEGKEAEAQGVTGMPSSFVFDRNGQLVASHIGFNSKKAPAIRRELEALLAK